MLSYMLGTIKGPLTLFGICTVFFSRHFILLCLSGCVLLHPPQRIISKNPIFSSLEKKSLLRDNVDLLVSLADVYFRAGDTKNAILKFEQAQMLDPYLIKGELWDGVFLYSCVFMN